MTKIETDIGYIKNSIVKIEDYISSADEKYANKETESRVSVLEKNVYKIMGGIVIISAAINFAIVYYRS